MKNKKLIQALTQLRKTANFENARFSDIKIGDKFESVFPLNRKASTDEITDGIKEATRLYRETWVTPIIDDLILWAKGEKEIAEIVRYL